MTARNDLRDRLIDALNHAWWHGHERGRRVDHEGYDVSEEADRFLEFFTAREVGLTPAEQSLNDDCVEMGILNEGSYSCDCNGCLRRRWERREAKKVAYRAANPGTKEAAPEPCPSTAPATVWVVEEPYDHVVGVYSYDPSAEWDTFFVTKHVVEDAQPEPTVTDDADPILEQLRAGRDAAIAGNNGPLAHPRKLSPAAIEAIGDDARHGPEAAADWVREQLAKHFDWLDDDATEDEIRAFNERNFKVRHDPGADAGEGEP